MAANASELYREMLTAISLKRFIRATTVPQSPQKADTYEADLCRSYLLRGVQQNLVDCRKTDLRWATANILHFFAGTEQGESLLKYNRHAARFLEPDGRWDGAYGAIAMPQIHKAIMHLLDDPYSRRAVVSMGSLADGCTVNRPACWSLLHFIRSDVGLDLIVYQRSLNLVGVFPYDCTLLCNILQYVSAKTAIPCGALHWTIGSLHTTTADYADVRCVDGWRNHGLNISPDVLQDRLLCAAMLADPKQFIRDYEVARYLDSETPVWTS